MEAKSQEATSLRSPPPVPDLQLVFSDLVRFQIVLWNTVDARLKADLALPLSSYETLRIVAEAPTCRVFDIADELAITVGGTSKIVDRLEAAGLLRRDPNPDDRRSSLVALTPAGATAFEGARATVDDELRVRLAEPLPAADLAAFAATLHHLRAATRTLARPSIERKDA